MTVTVNIWNSGEGNVGHAAVDVNGTYCSFWPGGTGYSDKNAAQKQSVPSANHSYDEDYWAEGRAPHVVLRLEGLDEQAMLDKWDDLKGEKYSFAKTNCSTVVAKMLEAGSDMKPKFKLAAWPSHYMPPGLLSSVVGSAIDGYAYATSQHKVWTPEQVDKFGQQIVQAQELALAREQARQQAEAQAREQARQEAIARERARQDAIARQEARERARQQRALERNPWAEHREQPRRRSSGDSSSSSGSERSYHTARSHTSNDGTQTKTYSYKR